ncbi:hypothetical protein U3516DRAFT_566666, partial [Neocallimastix sp. 'constans']
MVINSYLEAIDNKNIDKIKYLNNNKNKDIVLELYNEKKLSTHQLIFIIEKCSKYINVSSSLVKQLMKDENIDLLDIIFYNLKFFDNDLIKTFLMYYKNKIPLTLSELEQLISKDKYKI